LLALPLRSVPLAETPKSTPAHDAVAAVFSRKLHLIIHVGAGHIQLANGWPLLFDTDEIHHIFQFSPISWREFMTCILAQVDGTGTLARDPHCVLHGDSQHTRSVLRNGGDRPQTNKQTFHLILT